MDNLVKEDLSGIVWAGAGHKLTDTELSSVFNDSANGWATDDIREYILPKFANTSLFVLEENCQTDCNGWDGISRRCACGNRRVEWVLSHESVRPEAY